jgi:REP element-mobilizing transposase RayT
MSRKLRIQYPGAMYHVMNRGDQREDIFRDDDDREKFLCTVGEACAKTVDWSRQIRLGEAGVDEIAWGEIGSD